MDNFISILFPLKSETQIPLKKSQVKVKKKIKGRENIRKWIYFSRTCVFMFNETK